MFGLCGQPLQARLGLLFLFCLSFARLFSLLRGGAGLLSSRFAVVPDSSTAAPHASNRACSGLRWCRSPTLPSNRPYIATQGRVWFFLPRTSLPLPLKGEGRGITFLGLVGFALLVQNWGTLAQQGRSGASLVSFPYPAPKIAHRAAQGRVCFSSPKRVYPSP